MQMPRWEKVFSLDQTLEDSGAGVYRSWVPGGWLLMAMAGMGGFGMAAGTAFLPDLGHEWNTDTATGSVWEEVVLPRGLPGIGAITRSVRMRRCPVPGGWLVVTAGAYPSLVFCPDPERRWSEDAASELEASDAPAGRGTELMGG